MNVYYVYLSINICSTKLENKLLTYSGNGASFTPLGWSIVDHLDRNLSGLS